MTTKSFPRKVFLAWEDDSDGISFLIVGENVDSMVAPGDIRRIAFYTLTSIAEAKSKVEVTIKSIPQKK